MMKHSRPQPLLPILLSLTLGCGMMSAELMGSQAMADTEPVQENSPQDNSPNSPEKGMIPISLDMLKDKVSMEVNRPALLLDIPSVLELVSRQNLDVAIAQNQTLQAQSRIYKNAAQAMPSATPDNSVEHFTGGEVIVGPTPVNQIRTTFRPTLTGDYQFDLGGKPFFQVHISKLDVKRSELNRKRAFQKALLDSLTEYFDWIKSLYNVELAHKTLDEAEARVKVSMSRYKNGFGTHMEVTSAKASVEEFRSKMTEAENQEKSAESKLINHLNLPYEMQLLPKTAGFPRIHFGDEDKVPVTELAAFVEKNRPDVQAIQYQLKANQALLTSEILGMLPNITLSSFIRGIGPKMSNLDKSTRMFGSLSLDVLKNMGVGTYGNIKEAKAKIQEAKLQHEKLLNQIKDDMTQAYLDTKLYDSQRVMTLEKMQAASESQQVATSRFHKGFGIELEVLEAETGLSEARFEHITALVNYHTAKLKLLYELGLLTPEYILKYNG